MTVAEMQRGLWRGGRGGKGNKVSVALFLLRIVWICGLLTATLAALLSTHFFPALHSVFRSRHPPFTDLYKVSNHRLPKQEALRVDQALEADLIVNITEAKMVTTPPFPLTSKSSKKLDDADVRMGIEKLWKHPPSRGFKPCIQPSEYYNVPRETQGYLLVHTNGGLNQMRAGICDMVAVARIINATLIPAFIA